MLKLEVTTDLFSTGEEGEHNDDDEEGGAVGMKLHLATPKELSLPPFPECIPGQVRAATPRLSLPAATCSAHIRPPEALISI